MSYLLRLTAEHVARMEPECFAVDDLSAPRTDGAAVYCPRCGATFGGMQVCPWDASPLRALPDADPTAVAFYAAIAEDDC